MQIGAESRVYATSSRERSRDSVLHEQVGRTVWDKVLWELTVASYPISHYPPTNLHTLKSGASSPQLGALHAGQYWAPVTRALRLDRPVRWNKHCHPAEVEVLLMCLRLVGPDSMVLNADGRDIGEPHVSDGTTAQGMTCVTPWVVPKS